MTSKANTLKNQILKAAKNRPVKGLTVREAFYTKMIGETYSSVRARIYELADDGVLYRTSKTGETVKRNGGLVFFAE